MPKSGIEDRGLLQPEEFDIDDLDYLNTQNGYAESSEWSRSRKGRRRRWLRPRVICFGLAAVIALLIAGVALNKGGGFKIPKLNKDPDLLPQSPSFPPPPLPPFPSVSPPAEPDHVKPPAKVKPPAPEDTPEKSKFPQSPEKPASQKNDTEVEEIANKDKFDNSTDPLANLNLSSLGVNETRPWTKPIGFKIIGLLFFGRRSTVSILDCYLQKNLEKNGGWLDEVHFVVNTEEKADIKWLDKLVKKTKQYKKIEIEAVKGKDGYDAIWATCEKQNVYIKIDDDIVFFDEEAIPNLVYSLIKHPEALGVAANLINSPETGWLHYHMGAIHAYLPELSRKKEDLRDPESSGPKAWRASALPEWSGGEMSFPIGGFAAGKTDESAHLGPDVPGAPPFKGHRWLPLPGGDNDLWRTPMAESKYEENGPNWGIWSLGAQSHYSLLQNLENDELNRYYYGNGLDPKREGIWNMAYERYNINLMAIWGKDILDNLPFDSFDDELALSVQVPLKLRRRGYLFVRATRPC